MQADPAQYAHASLYIHWPYCEAKCPYCDFNVHLAKGPVDEDIWTSALLRDLADQLQGLPLAPLETIAFGGGTPSLLSPRSIGHILEGVQRLWPFAPAPQISLEVHPTRADAAKFAGLAAAGVNRVSLGVQSFDEAVLTFLGRNHSGADARQALAAARKQFDQLNLDLMSVLPGQSLGEQRTQIDLALETAVDHLSVYQLDIAPGTAFGAAVRRGDWQPKSADEAADFFEDAANQIVAAGFDHYEVSNFAKPGCENRHSLYGWLGRAYVGIGPGAEGRVVRSGQWRHRRTRRSPAAYLKNPKEIDAPLGTKERLVEQLIFGLRLTAGLPLEAEAWTVSTAERCAALVQSGDLEEVAGQRRATAQGRLRLDALTDYLINYERTLDPRDHTHR